MAGPPVLREEAMGARAQVNRKRPALDSVQRQKTCWMSWIPRWTSLALMPKLYV